MGILASTMHNLQLDRKHANKARSPMDFMPFVSDEAKQEVTRRKYLGEFSARFGARKATDRGGA